MTAFAYSHKKNQIFSITGQARDNAKVFWVSEFTNKVPNTLYPKATASAHHKSFASLINGFMGT